MLQMGSILLMDHNKVSPVSFLILTAKYFQSSVQYLYLHLDQKVGLHLWWRQLNSTMKSSRLFFRDSNVPLCLENWRACYHEISLTSFILYGFHLRRYIVRLSQNRLSLHLKNHRMCPLHRSLYYLVSNHYECNLLHECTLTTSKLKYQFKLPYWDREAASDYLSYLQAISQTCSL